MDCICGLLDFLGISWFEGYVLTWIECQVVCFRCQMLWNFIEFKVLFIIGVFYVWYSLADPGSYNKRNVELHRCIRNDVTHNYCKENSSFSKITIGR